MSRILGCVILLLCGSVHGQQFRIDTQVFANGGKKPIAESTTIFDNGVAYDFLKSPQEIAILHVNSGEVTLLDMAAKRRCMVTPNQMFQFVAAIEGRLLQKPNRVAVFLFNPKFQLKFNKVRRQIQLIHPLYSYTATGTPAKVDRADLHFQLFADGMARLNTLRNGVPPKPRLRLNLALASRKFLPTKVERKMAFGNGPKQTAKSIHKIKWMLKKEDLDRVKAARGYLNDPQFKQVTIFKFARRRGQVAKK